VYGHAKQGTSFGHTKIAGKTILRRGLDAALAELQLAATAFNLLRIYRAARV
jgi:hypothetical protein